MIPHTRARTMSGPSTTSGRVRARSNDDGVPAHLLCSVCLDTPCGRVEQCSNGHILCAEAGDGSCVSTMRAHARGQGTVPSCPECRVRLSDNLQRCLSAEQSIAALPAACRHCAEASTRGEVSGHEAECPRAPARCAAGPDGCPWEGLLGEREAHEAACMRGRAATRDTTERVAPLRLSEQADEFQISINISSVFSCFQI